MMFYRKQQALGCIVLLLNLLAWTSINAQSRFITARGKVIASPDGSRYSERH